MVDCADEHFEEKWDELSLQWPKEFVEYLNSTKLRVRSLKETMRLCMSRSTRIAAGLGNPPNKYDNQRAEALNNVLKEETGRVKVDQVALHELVEANIVDQQFQELSKALYGMGEYRLAPQYMHLQKSPAQWTSMKPTQRKDFIDKVLGSTSSASSPLQCDASSKNIPTIKLSIQPEACTTLTDLPVGVVQELWRRAEVILTHYEVKELGSGDFLVTEYDSATILRKTSNSLRCQCKQYSIGICAHVLAVADKTGELKTVVQNFKVKPSALINKQTSKGAGEKKGKKPRRGKNNVSLHDVQSEMSSAAVPSHADISCPKAVPFTAIYHNEEPFSVEFLCDIATKGKKVLMCESCKVRFSKQAVATLRYCTFAQREILCTLSRMHMVWFTTNRPS